MGKNTWLPLIIINKLIILIIIFMLLLPSAAKAQLEIISPVNKSVRPGQLKIFTFRVINKTGEQAVIRPKLSYPDDWNLVFPLNKFTIKPNKSKDINVFIKLPVKTYAGLYKLNLKLNSEVFTVNKNIGVMVEKVNEINVKLLNAPKYTRKNFTIELNIINNGNTEKVLNIKKDNHIRIKKNIIILPPFQNKVIKLKGAIDSSKDIKQLKIMAVDEKERLIQLFNRKIYIVDPIKNYRTYQSLLKISYKMQNKKPIRNWQITSYLDHNSYIKIDPKNINLFLKDNKKIWEIGTNLNTRFYLNNRRNQSNNLKLIYKSHKDPDFKKFIYTDFVNEILIGMKHRNKIGNYYLELKNNQKGNINYYFKSHFRLNKHKIFLQRVKNDIKNRLSFNFSKRINEHNKIKIGYQQDFWKDNFYNQYLKYAYDDKTKKIKVRYTDRQKEKRSIRTLTLMGKSLNREANKSQGFAITLRNEDKNIKFKSMKYFFKNQKHELIIENDICNFSNNIKFAVTRYFRKENSNLKLEVNNHGEGQINLLGKADIYYPDQKRFSLSGKLTYHKTNNKFDSSFQLGVKIPFEMKVKNRELIKVKGKVLTDKGEKVAGIVLSVNGNIVRTNKEGRFTSFTADRENVLIKTLDLNSYGNIYYITPNSPFLIKDYQGELISLTLKKYGNLYLKFQGKEVKKNKYLHDLKSKQKEYAYITLSNKEYCFSRSYNGEDSIVFKRIIPGKYNLKVESKSNNYSYRNEKKEIIIKAGKNNYVVEKYFKNNPEINFEQKSVELKTIN